MGRYIYFVEICDYEACWYDSMWEDEYKAKEAFDEYNLLASKFEQIKRFGYREINCKTDKGRMRLIKE